MKDLFNGSTRNKIVGILVLGWLLCILLAALVHSRVFGYFGVVLLIGAIVFFMISLLYALIGGDKGDSKPSDTNHDS